MFQYFFLSLLAIGALSDQTANNKAIDRILKGVNTILQNEYSDRLELNNLYEPYHFEFFGRRLEGEYWAETGVVDGLSTLVRKDNVVIENQNNKQKIKANLRFGQLRLSYDYYRMTYIQMDINGGMELRTNEATATVEISVSLSTNSCTVSADKVTINSLGNKLDMTFNGDKIPLQFRYLPEKWIVDSFMNNQKATAEANILSAINDALEKEDLCKLAL